MSDLFLAVCFHSYRNVVENLLLAIGIMDRLTHSTHLPGILTHDFNHAVRDTSSRVQAPVIGICEYTLVKIVSYERFDC